MVIYMASLPPGLERRDRPREETRTGRALLAYGLMRRGLIPRDCLPAGAETERLLRFGPRGKPEFIGLPLHFSISHSHGLVACALDGAPMGLDVERVREFPDPLAARVSGEEERRQAAESGDLSSGMTRLWTCKESYMKYTGLGMAQGPGGIRVAVSGRGARIAGQPGLVVGSVPLWRGGQRFWLSVCRAGPGPVALEAVPRAALGLRGVSP